MRSTSLPLIAAVVMALQAHGVVASGEPGAAEGGAPTLDLASLLREAEEKNPSIAAAGSRVSAAEAVPAQAEAYPDPLAGVTYQNESFTHITFGETEDSFLAFSWSQEVPYPGKRRLAGDVARGEVAMARRRADRIRRELSSEIKRVYAEIYRVDRTTSILTESRELLLSYLATARARYATGEGILENVLKAQTEITRLDAGLERLGQERLSAEAELKALVGRTGGEPLGPARTLPETAGMSDVAVLQREAAELSPEVLELKAAVQREEARVDLARKQLKPDLVWGTSYANRDGLDPMISGTFGLRLPLYRERRQIQGIAQARHEAEAARLDVDGARLRVAAEVADLAARASRARSLSRLYAEGILPQARSALESASAAYGVGRVDFLTLLTDFTTLLTYEVEYETQLAERVAALAALERLTGRELVLAGAGGVQPAMDGAHHE